MVNSQATATLTQVADHFSTILYGADPNRTMFYTFVNKTPAGMDPALAVLVALGDKPDNDRLIALAPRLWELSDERIRVLGKLYLSLHQLDRNSLILMSTIAFGRDSSHARYSAYLFTFLAKYHDLDAAIN